jgi:hypothetical protein
MLSVRRTLEPMSQTVFTFGRQHEKACAIGYVRDPSELPFVEQLIDAVHDLLEGASQPVAVMRLLEHGLAAGGSGVWEQTGVWLRKLANEYPELLGLWDELSNHRSATVRFRVAAHLSDMPPSLAARLGERLVADRSAKVRQKAAGDLALVRAEGIATLLQRALAAEKNEVVVESIRWAIEERNQKIPDDHSGGA